MKKRGTEYEDVHFYTLWEDYEKNQQELRAKGLILDGALEPLDPSFKPFNQPLKPLDPNFKPWSTA